MQINQEKIPWCQKNRRWNCAGSAAVQSIYKVSVGGGYPNEYVILTIWSWFFFLMLSLSSGWGSLWWYYDDPFLQHKAPCSVSSDVINYTICLILICLSCNILPHCWSHIHTWSLHVRKTMLNQCSLTHTHTHTLLTTHPWSVMEKPHVASCRHADSHQDTLISLFSSGLLIPFLPYAAYMDYHMLLNSVWIRPEVITLNT